MNNFTYYAPTKVVFGKDTENEAGVLVKEFGGSAKQVCRKVLVHYGGTSAVKSGLLDRVCASLEQAGLEIVKLGGVVPNPRLSLIYEGIELCKKEGVDFILAVGGGSVMDSAKAIGYGLADDGDVWDFYERKRAPSGCFPLGCVVTISASGSEMSDSSVITNEKGWLKRGCNNNHCRMKFAILNPELTFTLPWYQTASGAVDIMMHTLERWFDDARVSTELTDSIAVSLLKTVMRNSLILKENHSDYNAAAEIMWAGSLSHNGLTGAGGGTPAGDWSCHQLEHELGGMFDVTHGAGLSAVWGSWARFVSREKPQRFVKLGKELFGAEDAEQCIKKIEDFFVSIDMPINIAGLYVTPSDEQIKELAYKCSFFGNRKVGFFRPLEIGDLEEIFFMARE